VASLGQVRLVCCDRDSGRPQRCAPPEAGIKPQESAPADSCLADQQKAHRVGLAFVQLTRSTFAEAIAGRESLQPRALRARCTRKPTARFGRRQAPVRDNVSQSARIVFLLGFAREIRSTQKHTEAVAPSSDLPTDRRRSDCLSEGHQPPALRPRCTRDTRASRRCRQAASKHNCRSLRDSLYNADILALSPVCSTCVGPRIRRAGCAFVHFPG